MNDSITIMKHSERVLAFPTEYLTRLGCFQGVVTDRETLMRYLERLMFLPQDMFYLPRETLETDPTFKQVIPYIVLRCQGKYFQYQRTKKGGESRLHDKWSIGVGGHINPADYDPAGLHASYANGFFRELEEETGILLMNSESCRNSVVGLINDDSDDVGKVHFGIVHLLDIQLDHTMHFKDEALSPQQFVSLSELKDSIGKFEKWSQLVINSLKEL